MMLNIEPKLSAGEEVKIHFGEKFYAPPTKVTFVKEHSNHLQFEGTFEEGKEVFGIRKRSISISKPSIFCGDAKVQKVASGELIRVKAGESYAV